MKKIVLLLLTLAVVLSLCACEKDIPAGNSNPTISSSPSIYQHPVSTPASTSRPTEPAPTTPPETIEITSRQAFSDNVAWIKYKKGNASYYALIDWTGHALCHFSEQGILPQAFSGGYAFVENISKSTFYIFGTSGTICSSYQTSYNKKLVTQDSGYYIIKEEVSGFSSSGYKYVIYNPFGSVLDTVQFERETAVTACGKGIFYFKDKGYFCAPGNVWYDPSQLDSQMHAPVTFTDPNADSIIVGYKSTLLGDQLVALNPHGEVTTQYIRLAYEPDDYHFSSVDSNVCTCRYYMTGELYAFHFDTGKVYQLDKEYSDKINIDTPPTPRGRYVVISMTGADRLDYIIVTDLTLKPVFGPMQTTDRIPELGNELLVFSATGQTNKIVYSATGKKVFSLTDLGYNNEPRYGLNQEQAYSCGYLLVWNNKTGATTYLDVAGYELEIFLNCGKPITL